MSTRPTTDDVQSAGMTAAPSAEAVMPLAYVLPLPGAAAQPVMQDRGASRRGMRVLSTERKRRQAAASKAAAESALTERQKLLRAMASLEQQALHHEETAASLRYAVAHLRAQFGPQHQGEPS